MSFANWQKQQINEKRFWASDSCYPGWFDKHDVNETLDNLIYGFPSDSSIKFSFADLNQDGNLDGLVTFNADQCDGGNASTWNQWQVFILSNNGNYNVNDTIQVDKFSLTEFDSLGFYRLDSIKANKIFGTYIEFKDEDGRCCPSINRPVAFDFSGKRLVFTEAKRKRKPPHNVGIFKILARYGLCIY